MLLASKLEDLQPIPIQLLVERVAQGRFTAEDIKAREREMLSVLDFDVTFPTVHDFIDDLLVELVAKDNVDPDETTLNTISKIREQALFFAMMACFDYRMLNYT
jgi:hypothetical protein